MRKVWTVLTVGALLLAVLSPLTAVAEPRSDRLDRDARRLLALGAQAAPKATKPGARPQGANPYLALLPDPSKVDYRGWQRYLEARSAAKAAQRERAGAGARELPGPPQLVDEDEPPGVRGSNDTPATAQRVPGFGTAGGENQGARVLGSLSVSSVVRVPVRPNAENDGAIPLARRTRVGSTRDGVRTTGRIGDGPHGKARSGRGDFDFYRVRGLAGRVLRVDIATPTGPLDPMVAVYDAAGRIVAFNDDSDSLDSALAFRVPTTGTYYVMATGFDAMPRNPFRSGSGTGAASEGPYQVRIALVEYDVDHFAFYLRPGDVLGTTVSGAAPEVTVWDPEGTEVQGSRQDLSFIYPMDTPLPAGGNAVGDHVADEEGWHTVSVGYGSGRYDLTVEAYRPGPETAGAVQTVFLDFDGARVNTRIWGGPGVRTLSPLSAFLGRWGLTSADEDAVVTTIVEEVRESLETDPAATAVRILNSRDDPDPWGQPDVSRVIVGGTVEQSGVDTIGVAESIDPGDFGAEESALVLLDYLSAPAGGYGDPSLNTYLGPASDRVGFVGHAVGNVVAHEAGHFLGDWHVDQFNDVPNLMDQGGNFPVLFGVGPDRVGGTADDVDVDFGEDTFTPDEGFTGVEDTLSRLAVVLTG